MQGVPHSVQPHGPQTCRTPGQVGFSVESSASSTTCNVLCFIRTCCFNPFSEVDVYSHCSQLNARTVEFCFGTAVFSTALGFLGADTAGSLTTSSAILDFLASLLLSSLRIWLGDFFFKVLPQELATSSLLSNLKVSFPMERVKVELLVGRDQCLAESQTLVNCSFHLEVCQFSLPTFSLHILKLKYCCHHFRTSFLMMLS